MGRKRSEDINDNQISQVTSLIKKEYGNVVISGDALFSRKRKIIPTTPALDQALGGGIPEGSWVVVTGPEKFGKAQPFGSKVYTPKGPVNIESLSIDSEVCTPYGDIAKVTGIFPQGIKDVYKITFLDGDTVECCKEHLWKIKSINRRYKNIEQSEVVNLEYIINHFNKNKERPTWSIELPFYCYFNKQKIELDPYILGVLLGDGCFRKQVMITNTNKQLLTYVENNIGKDYIIRPVTLKKPTIDYRIRNKTRFARSKYRDFLRKYDLWNKKSKDKFIPEHYKYNSYDVRISLIKGLMDSDGYVAKNGHSTFYTSSMKLAKDFKELIMSIGGLCKIANKTTYCNGQKFKSYVCLIRFFDTRILFKIKSKKQRGRKQDKHITRMIKNIEYVGKKECVCISIDNEHGLYLTDNYVVTHNTTNLLHAAVNAQQPEYGGKEVIYIDAEARLKEMNLNSFKKLNKDKFHLIISERGKPPLTAENFLNIAIKYLMDYPGCFMIFDSVSALCEKREREGGVGTETRGGGSKLVAQFIRDMAQVVNVNDNIVCMVTHMMANTSGRGHLTVIEKTAYELKYQVDVKLRAISKEIIYPTSDKDKAIGQRTNWLVEYNALGASPGQKVDTFLRYGEGMDEIYDWIDFGVALGLITLADGGAWYTLNFYEETKIQGKEKLRAYLFEEVKVLNILQEKVKTLIS